MKPTKSSLEKKISTATNSSHHILVFITPEITVISWKPQEVDCSVEEISLAKELCVTGTNYIPDNVVNASTVNTFKNRLDQQPPT